MCRNDHWVAKVATCSPLPYYLANLQHPALSLCRRLICVFRKTQICSQHLCVLPLAWAMNDRRGMRQTLAGCLTGIKSLSVQAYEDIKFRSNLLGPLSLALKRWRGLQANHNIGALMDPASASPLWYGVCKSPSKILTSRVIDTSRTVRCYGVVGRSMETILEAFRTIA